MDVSFQISILLKIRKFCAELCPSTQLVFAKKASQHNQGLTPVFIPKLPSQRLEPSQNRPSKLNHKYLVCPLSTSPPDKFGEGCAGGTGGDPDTSYFTLLFEIPSQPPLLTSGQEACGSWEDLTSMTKALHAPRHKATSRARYSSPGSITEQKLQGFGVHPSSSRSCFAMFLSTERARQRQEIIPPLPPPVSISPQPSL